MEKLLRVPARRRIELCRRMAAVLADGAAGIGVDHGGSPGLRDGRRRAVGHDSAAAHVPGPDGKDPLTQMQYNTHTMASLVSRTEREMDLQHLWHGNLQHHGLDKRPPLEIARAEGCFVYDSEEHRYLDAMAGLWCVNVGYGRRALVEAVTEQMARLPYYPLTQSHPPGAQLAGRLAGLLPAGLSRVFFLNSGSEAVETALKMARQHARRAHPAENRYKIIARHRAYHGFTMGALSATGQVARTRA